MPAEHIPLKRVRFQDLETVCRIDLGLAFGDLVTEYYRVMRRSSPEPLFSPVPLSQQEAFMPSSARTRFSKPDCIPPVPADRGELMEIFAQVQYDAEVFSERGIHILDKDAPVRTQHAGLCLAAANILRRFYNVEVY